MSARKKPRGPKSAPKPVAKPPRADTEKDRFVDDLVSRGEAVPVDEDGTLPPGATHEILTPSGAPAPRARRRRFSIGP